MNNLLRQHIPSLLTAGFTSYFLEIIWHQEKAPIMQTGLLHSLVLIGLIPVLYFSLLLFAKLISNVRWELKTQNILFWIVFGLIVSLNLVIAEIGFNNPAILFKLQHQPDYLGPNTSFSFILNSEFMLFFILIPFLAWVSANIIQSDKKGIIVAYGSYLLLLIILIWLTVYKKPDGFPLG